MRAFAPALVALGLATPAIAQETQAERDVGWIQGLIEDNLSDTGREVIIEGFEGALSSQATIESLTIADDEGIWLRAEGLTLDWTRSALLGGALEVSELSADVIELVRPPVATETIDVPSPEATPFEFALPELPVSVQIDTLRADRIILGAPVLGQEYAFDIAAEITLDGGEGAATLNANRLDATDGRFAIDVSYSNTTRVLGLTVNLTEAEDGLVATALGIPDRPSVALSLDGTAPVDDYAADLAIATAGVDRIVGNFGFINGDAGQEVVLDISGDVNAFITSDYEDFFGPNVRLAVQGARDETGALNLSQLLIEAQSLTLQGAANIGADGWPDRLDLTGQLASADGSPVLVPFIDTETLVGDATFELTFDATRGEEWTTALEVTDVTQPTTDIAALTLTGGGVIQQGEGNLPALVTGDLAYAARGLALADPALAEAVGTDITGDVIFEQAGNAPFRISSLTLTGPGIEAAAEATLTTDDTARIDASILLEASDLARFGPLTGLQSLGGGAELIVVAGVQPLDGIFDATVIGSTEALSLGIAELDPQIGGDGELILVAARDIDGTRIEQFGLTTSALSATGSADLTSTGSTADFEATLREIGLSIPDLSGPADLLGTLRLATDGSGLADVALTMPGTQATINADIAAPAQGGLIALDVAANVDDLAPYADITGQPLAGAADFAVTGMLARDASRADLDLTAQTETLQIGIPQADNLLTGPATITARLRRLNIAAFRIERFDLTAPRMTAQADASLTFGALAADIDVALTDVADVLPGVSGAATLDGQITRSSGGDLTADVSATGPGGTTAQIDASLSALMAFDGSLTAQVAQLSAFNPLAPHPLQGAAAITFTGTIADITSPTTTDFDGQLTANATNAAYGETGLEGRVALTGPLSRVADLIRIDITATGPADTRLAVDATLDTTSGATGAASLTTQDIARYAALAGVTADGSIDLSLDGTAALDASALDLQFAAAGRDLSFQDFSLPGQLSADGTATRDGTAIGIDLAAQAPGDTALTLRAILDETAGAVSGALSLNAGSIAPYSDLAGRSLAGALVTTLEGSGQLDGSRWDLAFDVAGEGLSAAGIDLTGGVDLAGTTQRTADNQIALDLAGTAPGGTSIDLSARGTDTLQTSLALSIDRLQTYAGLIGQPLSGSANVALNGTVTPFAPAFDLQFDGQTTNLNPGIAEVARLLSGTGSVSGSASLDAGGTLRLQNAALRYPNITANADLTSQGGAASGDFDVRLADVALFTDVLSGPATASGTAGIAANGTTRLNISATGPGGLSADVAGTVASNATLALNITGATPLALANSFIEPRRVSGDARFDIAVNGPPALSSVTGILRISDGRLATPTLQRALEDIGGSIRLTGSSALLDIEGALEDGGRITVSGPVGLTGGLEAGLRIAGQGLVLRDPTLYETTVDAEINIVGPLAGNAQITGGINLGPTEIQVPSSTASALGTLPQVTHFGAPADVRQTLDRAGLTLAGVDVAEAEGGNRPGYGLDITISAPSRVFIRGRGLDAELGGSLRITGSTNQIIPIGSFDLVRGRIDILEQRFALTEGSAILQGDFDPFLRLVASTEAADGTEVSITVEGPATAPEVTFSSSPELPQDEVLARLIFGRDLSSISPFQAIQLAAAVSTLAGGGSGVLADFRQGLGLDDFDVTTDEDGNAAVRAGAYISDNVYTDVTVGSENTEINLNLDLTDDIRITGSTSTDGNTGIGVFFERDY